jgi:hypothetical protein
MKNSNWFAAAIFFLLVTPRLMWLHGRTWEFGPHGLPVSILSADGQTYRDGSQIDALSAAIIRSGVEEPMWAAWVAFMGWAAVTLAMPRRARKSKVEMPSKSAGR